MKKIFVLFFIAIITTLGFEKSASALSIAPIDCNSIGSINLSIGSRKSSVRDLQLWLQTNNYEVSTTGFFGPVTAKAIKKFQKDNGISQTGNFGPKTRSKFKEICNSKVTSNTTPTINMQDDQIATWNSIPELLKSGKVASVMQTHSLKVTLTLKDGVNRISTTAPRIDAIIEEINKCGNVCKNIVIGTE